LFVFQRYLIYTNIIVSLLARKQVAALPSLIGDADIVNAVPPHSLGYRVVCVVPPGFWDANTAALLPRFAAAEDDEGSRCTRSPQV
jgi:hypothetical protein